MIPIAVSLVPPPVKPVLMAWKGRAGEHECEAPISIRYISNDTINHRVGASDERLLRQADARIVENPHAMILVRGDDVDCVHVFFFCLLRRKGRKVGPFARTRI